MPLEEFVDTFTFQTFEPRGMVEGHENIKMSNSIVDYVKSRFYQDKAGNSNDGALAQVSLNLASVHESKWREAVKKNGMRKRDKTGGTRAIRFPSFR